MDEPLPELLEETVDATGLAATFDRIAATGGLQAVLVKAAPTVKAQDPRGPEALGEAREGLLAGRLNGVQLRYFAGDREWCDTIMVSGPGAWRVVRIARD